MKKHNRAERALITGASSGLGAATAQALAARGVEVLLVARRGGRLRRLRAEIARRGGVADFLRVDLAHEGELRALATWVRRLGGVDLLINNAGAYLGGVTTWETPPDSWNRLLAVNLRAPFLLCRACVPLMRKQNGGRIINVISATRELSEIGAFRVS